MEGNPSGLERLACDGDLTGDARSPSFTLLPPFWKDLAAGWGQRGTESGFVRGVADEPHRAIRERGLKAILEHAELRQRLAGTTVEVFGLGPGHSLRCLHNEDGVGGAIGDL